MHHKDAYPKGNDDMGPDASLRGRNLGSDFQGKDGWNMYHGDTITIDETNVEAYHNVKLSGDEIIEIKNGSKESYLLLLEGEPIGEPVVSYGPFVMTSEKEIQEAFADYRSTGFGGWTWGRDDFAHPREKGRFAQYPDGSVEYRDVEF